MLKLGSTEKAMGTAVRCPACRYANLGIDIWCERCGAPLEASPAEIKAAAAAPSEPPESPEPPSAPATPALYCPNCGAAYAARDQYCPRCGSALVGGSTRRHPSTRSPRVRKTPAFTLPRLTMPAISLPHMRKPTFAVPELRLPRVSRLVWVVMAVLALLLIAPLVYVLLPSIRPVAARPSSGSQLMATNGGAPSLNSAEAVAIAGVKAKTGLPYAAGKCASNAPCLTVAGQTLGQNAAAVLFSTASSGGRQCVGYVYRSGGSWHFLGAVCGLPGQLSPMVGHVATVHVPGNCANVRAGASLRAVVIACLKDGTTVQVDGGPTYADGRLWWHEKHGWIAQDFLG
ncbi:MAG TPA: zinc ribbon domain-containing protein [Candidatus Dormibacteraeota bacterium]|nr:zinc ribbon domain-containing protein [Candidatus Dormibacteraeota bacterium]